MLKNELDPEQSIGEKSTPETALVYAILPPFGCR
jgi:hypothetical protein